MSVRCCRRCRSRGLTLVEVVAGLALLGTLLASVLVGFGRHMKQFRAAHERLAATASAERLLSEWSAQDGIPRVGSQQELADSKGCWWRILNNEVPPSQQLAVPASVRLEIVRSKERGQEQVLAAVNLLVLGNQAAKP